MNITLKKISSKIFALKKINNIASLVSQVNNNRTGIFFIGGSFPFFIRITRSLFCAEHLGIDVFQRTRFVSLNLKENDKKNFFEKVNEHLKGSSSNIIFTEDLKLAISLAENDEEIDIVVKMVKRFNIQNYNFNFSSFVFGPQVLRLLHLSNKPQHALQLFQDQKFIDTMFFDQSTSHLLLLDLLYQNQMYFQVIFIFDQINESINIKNIKNNKKEIINTNINEKKRNIKKESNEISKTNYYNNQTIEEKKNLKLISPYLSHASPPILHPSPDLLTLLAASCYKINTRDSLEKIDNVIKTLSNKMTFSVRMVVYASTLAYNQNEPMKGLKFLSMVTNPSRAFGTTAYINIHILLLVQMGSYNEALEALEKAHLSSDVFQEVMEKLEEKLLRNPSYKPPPLLVEKINKIAENLKNLGRLMPISFDRYLSSIIRKKKSIQQSFKHRRSSKFSEMHERNSRGRPGLI